MARKRRKVLRFFGWLVAIPIGLAMLGAVTIQAAFSAGASHLSEELKIASDAGMPLTLAEFQKSIHVDEADNAAQHYRKAQALRKSISSALPKDFDKALSGYSDLDPDQRDAILRKGFPALKPCLDEVAKAARMKGVDWGHDWSRGYSALLPEYAQLKDFAKLLSMRARLEAEDGHADAALADVDLCFRMSRHAAWERVGIATLVSESLNAIATAGLSKVLDFARLSPDQLATVDRLLDQSSVLPDMRAVVANELIILRTTLDNPQVMREVLRSTECQDCSDSVATPGDPDFWAARDPAVLHAWEATAVKYSRIYFTELPANGATAAQIEKANDKLDRLLAKDTSVGNRYNQMYFVTFNSVPSQLRLAAANQRMLRLAIAIERVRQTTGKLPQQPPHLTLGMDPFSGKPLGYRRVGDGFEIYSAGQDKVDDHGLSREEAKKRSEKSRSSEYSPLTWDLVLSVGVHAKTHS